MSQSEIANSINPILEDENEEGLDPNSTIPRMEISGFIPEEDEPSAWPTSPNPLLTDIAEGGSRNSRQSIVMPRRISASQMSTTGTIIESAADKKARANQQRRPSISQAIGSMFSKKKSVSASSADSSPKKRAPSMDELPMSVSTANFFRETEGARNSNDAFQLFSNAVLKNLEPTSLNVTWKGNSVVLKAMLDRTAADLVMDIIVHLQLEKKGINPSGYRVAKIDHQNPGTFMWLVPHYESSIYNLRNGVNLLIG